MGGDRVVVKKVGAWETGGNKKWVGLRGHKARAELNFQSRGSFEGTKSWKWRISRGN